MQKGVNGNEWGREANNLIRIPYTDLRVLRKPIQDQSNK